MAAPGVALAARRRSLLAVLRRCPEEAALLHAPPPEIEALESSRLAAPYAGGQPVFWQRLKLTPKQHVDASGPAGSFNLLVAWPAKFKGAQLPAVVLMHSTGKCKEYVAEHLERLAKRGFFAVAFDARGHGERALPRAGLADVSLQALGAELVEEILNTEQQRLPVYHAELVNGWQNGTNRYVMDIATDALSVVDHLASREDVDKARIGAVGISLGGMACWLLAAADERIFAAAPAIGVQSFHHSLVNGLWDARVATIRAPFEAAAKDMGKAAVDAEVVAAVWRRIAPGLAEADASLHQAFDAPLTLPCVAPRPLLVANGAKDPRCPLDGVHIAMASTREAYQRLGATARLRLFVEQGVEHEMTPRMWREIDLFLEAWLLPRRTSAL